MGIDADSPEGEEFMAAYELSAPLAGDIHYIRNTEDYDLSLITDTPFGFFMTENDTMCTKEWSEWAANEIG